MHDLDQRQPMRYLAVSGAEGVDHIASHLMIRKKVMESRGTESLWPPEAFFSSLPSTDPGRRCP